VDRLARLWYRVSSTFWFLPAAIVAGATALAFVAIEADARYVAADALEAWPRFFGAGPSASRSVLTAVAGSMITVAGTVFSITLVALSLASSQYSSRVLRNYMRDRPNQAVLGIFVGIFAYCLVVLRSIHGEGDDAFVPSVAVLLGLVLGFGGIGVLVFFIHHIAQSIQASQILQAVRVETCQAIDRLFPRRLRGDACEVATPPALDWHEARRAGTVGYLQFVDYARLHRIARAHAVRFKVHVRVGDYVLADDRLLSASPSTPDGLGEEVADCWTIGPQRTLEQDIGFGLRQLVDVALKALSPGVNDTTTAVMCIDAITAVLVHAAPRDLRFDGCDDAGAGWVEAEQPRFADMVQEGFDQIRSAGRDNAAVMDRLRWALEALAAATSDPERRVALRQQALRLRGSVERDLRDPDDRLRLHAALAPLLRDLDAAATARPD
jgi:uncharacterized membrane protein